MQDIILADNQDITRAGFLFLLEELGYLDRISEVSTKKELLQALGSSPRALVILDYTLFDIENPGDLHNIHEKYRDSKWLLSSSDLSEDFIRQIVFSTYNYSLILKDSSIEEFRACIKQTDKGSRYLSNAISNNLLESGRNQPKVSRDVLTPTEKDILKDIAMGLSTKDIAAQRHISVHTVMTHRKNIFRKIEVNNILEATKYAMRAGIVDLSDYYI